VKILARTSLEVAPRTILLSGLQMKSKFLLPEKQRNKKRKKRKRLPNILRFGIKKLPLLECL
jgi:hypothetical protein